MEYTKKSYYCSHCGNLLTMIKRGSYSTYFEPNGEFHQYTLLECPTCTKPNLLHEEMSDEEFEEEYDFEKNECIRTPFENIIYPGKNTNIPEPNSDIPDDIKNIYNEAKNIFNCSPRGACALLRLAIQMLCIELGEKGEKLNDDIACLVRKGLSPMIQKALDSVRVIGNNAVHPGMINIQDDPSLAKSLFDLVNVISEEMISRPKQIDKIYSNLPEREKVNIKKRDKK